jgi:trans-2,3-dihydro-3-hydroxyanthranilate isomerase
MSRSFRFALVDAFSSTPLQGNPCAVVLDAEQLSGAEMLAIAKEMNQSETAFLSHSKVAHLKARYFTPEKEIPLAGHPTIASVHTAIELGLITLLSTPALQTSIQVELKDGPIEVQIERTKDGNLIRMFQREPRFSELHDPTVVLPLFALSEEDLLPGAQIQTVSTGTRQLMVPLKNHDSLKKISMNAESYRNYREKMDFFSPHFFCLQGINQDAATFARHLGTPPDTLEDAFTGSATGAMAAYLWKYGLIQEPKFIAEQGHWMGRPGRAYVEIQGTREQIESVSVAGFAVTVVSGKLTG